MRRHLVTLAGLAALAMPLLSPAPARAQEDINVLFVLYDDLGLVGDLGPYGANPLTLPTPFSDAVGAEAKIFDHFYSNGVVCSPTRIAFTTGQHPTALGMNHALGSATNDRGVPAGAATLARYFRDDLGYRTGAFGKWHIGAGQTEYTPAGVGFDEVAVACTFGNISDYDTAQFCSAPGVVLGDSGSTHATEYTVAKAYDFIEDAIEEEEPFFAQVWLHAPHTPLHCPPGATCPLCREDVCPRDYHELMIAHAESQLMTLYDLLDNEGVLDNTLIIIASDNGASADTLDGGVTLAGSKGAPYEGGIRVPFMVRLPNDPTSEEVTDPATSQDLLATLAEYFDTPATGYQGSGVSFLDALGGTGTGLGDRTLFWDARTGVNATSFSPNLSYPWLYYAAQKVIASDHWKVVKANLFHSGVIPELYDLDNDPNETTNLAFNATYQSKRNHLLDEFSNLRMEESYHRPVVDDEIGSMTYNDTTGVFTFTTPGMGVESGVATLIEHPATRAAGLNFSVSFTITPTAIPTTGIQARLVERHGSWSVRILGNGKVSFRAWRDTDNTEFGVTNRTVLTANNTYRITAVYEFEKGLSLYVNDVLERANIPLGALKLNANQVSVGRLLSSDTHPYFGTLQDLRFNPIVVRPEDLEFTGATTNGFETGDATLFSTVANGSLAAETTIKHRGSRSLKHISSAANSLAPSASAGSQVATSAGDGEYQLSVWVRGNSGSEQVSLHLVCRDGSGNVLSDPWATASSKHIATLEWRRLTLQHLCPSSASTLGVRLGNDTSGNTVFWDDLSVGKLSKAFASYNFESTDAPWTEYSLAGSGHTGSSSLEVPNNSISARKDVTAPFSGEGHYVTSFWANASSSSARVRLWFYCLDSGNSPLNQVVGYCPTSTTPPLADYPTSDAACVRTSPGRPGPSSDWQKFQFSATCPASTAKIGVRLETNNSGVSVLVDDLTLNATSVH